MALPYSRNTTYAAGDEILSADLNALQDAAAQGATAAYAMALFADGASGSAWTLAGSNAICWSGHHGTAVLANLTSGTFQFARGWGFAGSASSFTPGVTVNASIPGAMVSFGSVIVAGYGCSASSANRVCTSTDGGATFAPYALPWAGTAAVMVMATKDWILAVDSSTRTVARSVSGASWASAGTMPAGTVPGNRMQWAADPSTGVIVTASGGSWARSDDGGSTWTTPTVPITTIHGVTWDKALGLFYALGLVSGTRSAYTSPDGVTWTAASHVLRGSALSSSAVVAPAGEWYGMVAATGSAEFLAKMPQDITWRVCRPSVSALDDLLASSYGWLAVSGDTAIFGRRMS